MSFISSTDLHVYLSLLMYLFIYLFLMYIFVFCLGLPPKNSNRILEARDWFANTDVIHVANMAEVKGQFSFSFTLLCLYLSHNTHTCVCFKLTDEV